MPGCVEMPCTSMHGRHKTSLPSRYDKACLFQLRGKGFRMCACILVS